MSNQTKLEQALASGGNAIGYLTWYDCRNAAVTPTMLKMLFDKHGLDNKYFPDTIKPKNAFQKACRQAQNQTGSASDNRRSVVKIIVDGMEKLIYGVVDLDVNENQESISPEFSDKVWFDKGNLSVGFDKGHPTSKKVKEIYDKMCGEYMTRDISRMIVKSVDRMCSISLRDGGVIYFIPVAFDKDLHALQNVVNEIGQCNMRVFTIGDANGNAGNLVAAAKSQIGDKIQQMKDDILDLKASISNNTIKGKTVENSVEVRMRRYKEIKQRCSILADALKIKAETLESGLSEVGDLLKDELLQAADNNE